LLFQAQSMPLPTNIKFAYLYKLQNQKVFFNEWNC
jgi:hypothetical protein